MTGEKLSPSTTNDDKVVGQTNYVDLDEQRRAALAEIDNAPFSCVHTAYRFLFCSSPRIIGGSI